ncbi:MAG: DUF192 domain-containing protein [Chloroflexi bacterium]|nr:DUF192 domain-containing protein [Chloroflexota bacterium]
MRRKAFLVSTGLIALLALFAAACGSDGGGEPAAVATPDATALASGPLIDVRIGGLIVHAEPARTAQERAHGLSGRDALPEDGGMLFFLGEERMPSFTMNQMRFPLDFVWISRDLRVADVTEHVPHPALAGETLNNIQPGVPVLYVLEVDAGTIEENGVEVGDSVTFDPDVSQETP